ncbi:hypothetical protein SDC9_177372 [bioreactor metagenome]|uniref:ABC transporter domain-containing protein n=1 Tax=bioreactor metagenome TaxID=1076179 RepID=A0A645GSN2_9ZZZZ
MLEISDRVTILRKGKSIDTVVTSQTSQAQLTELMVGRPVSLEIDRPETHSPKPILKVVDLTVPTPDGGVAIDDISFDIRTGEILGVAGVAGSGQKELCETIAGLLKPKKGAVLYKKENNTLLILNKVCLLKAMDIIALSIIIFNMRPATIKTEALLS